MKLSFYFMCFSLTMAFSLSNVLAVEAEGITPYERELLQFSKDICDREVGIKKYELGLETQIVDGPDLILESRVGVYYTGRVEMIRWGKDFDVPLSKYQWNPDKGNRWWCGFEKVVNFYDELGNWVRFTGGPNRTRDFRGAREITIIRLGEKPDWELFPGINRPRGE